MMVIGMSFISMLGVDHCASGALLDQVVGESLHSAVEVSGVLGFAVLHLHFRIPGANQVVVLGLGNTGSSLVLNHKRCTFLR